MSVKSATELEYTRALNCRIHNPLPNVFQRLSKSPTFPVLKYISLFSGCGGFDVGFHKSGFECLGSFDIAPLPLQVLTDNLSTPIIEADLSSHVFGSAQDFRADVVLAGPPCQGFSTAGARRLDDPRNRLLVKAALLAIELHPQVVLLENVRGASSGEHAKFLAEAEALLRQAGYQTRRWLLKLEDFGLPQMRQRILLAAWKGQGDFSLPQPNHSAPSLANLFANLRRGESTLLKQLSNTNLQIARRIKQGQKLSNVRGGSRSVHTWEIPEVFGRVSKAEVACLEVVMRLRRRDRVRSGGDADPVDLARLEAEMKQAPLLVDSLLKKGYLRRISKNQIDLTHTFNGKYRRLSAAGIAPTVDTRFGDPTYFLHPSEHRGLSVEEAAAIQGFPSSFKFSGPVREQFRMIGNAVPPTLSSHLALFTRDYLIGNAGGRSNK